MLIDTRGKICPEPVIMTKRALSTARQGEKIEIVGDNDTVRLNLMTYLASLAIEPVCENDTNEGFRIVFVTGGGALAKAEEAAVEHFSCEVVAPDKGNYAVVLRGKVMGAGDDKLGALLMRSCINSLPSLDKLPSIVVLYNAGVFLAARDSDTAHSLAALQQAGVEIIVCGTCTDYFELNDKIAVGTISNMLTINNKLASVGTILYP